MSQAVEHLSSRVQQSNLNTQKISYNTETKGVVSKKTEYRNEYPGYMAKPDKRFNYPDILKNNGPMLLNPTTKDHYKSYKGDPKVKASQDQTTEMKINIKNSGRLGHLFKDAEEHQNKYTPKNPAPEEVILQKTVWFKEKSSNLKDLPLDLYEKNKLDYCGESQEFPEKQNERFDNLKNPAGVQVNNGTTYKNDFTNDHLQESKVKAVELNKKLGKINEDLNTKESNTFKNPEWKGDSSYKRDYSASRTDEKAKNLVDKDKALAGLMHQLHTGYHYKA
jgi:hypothetical protein